MLDRELSGSLAHGTSIVVACPTGDRPPARACRTVGLLPKGPDYDSVFPIVLHVVRRSFQQVFEEGHLFRQLLRDLDFLRILRVIAPVVAEQDRLLKVDKRVLEKIESVVLPLRPLNKSARVVVDTHVLASL